MTGVPRSCSHKFMSHLAFEIDIHDRQIGNRESIEPPGAVLLPVWLPAQRLSFLSARVKSSGRRRPASHLRPRARVCTAGLMNWYYEPPLSAQRSAHVSSQPNSESTYVAQARLFQLRVRHQKSFDVARYGTAWDNLRPKFDGWGADERQAAVFATGPPMTGGVLSTRASAPACRKLRQRSRTSPRSCAAGQQSLSHLWSTKLVDVSARARRMDGQMARARRGAT